MNILTGLLLAANLTCPFTKLVLPAGEKPNELDKATVKRARFHCKELYPRSPCAKTVSRKNKLDYQVICGKAVSR